MPWSGQALKKNVAAWLVPLGEGGIKGGLGYPAIVNELVPPKGQIKNCGRYVFWKTEARLKGYRNKYKNKHKKKSDETNLGAWG